VTVLVDTSALLAVLDDSNHPTVGEIWSRQLLS
jgi:hypothetical protein